MANADITWTVTDADGDIATTGTTIVIGLAGLYGIAAGMAHTAGTGSQPGQLRVKVNGAIVAQDHTDAQAVQRGASCSRYMHLADGDVITMDAVSALTGGKLLDKQSTFLSVVRVGPVRWT